MTLSTETSDRGDKRERILDAALELFAERGFHGTAVPLVAERAKVGAGTIYRYFENKEALVNAVYRRWKETVLLDVTRDLPTEAPPRELFHQLFRRIVRFATTHPAAFQFLELHHHAPYLDDQSRALERRALDLSLMFLAETQRKRVTKPVDGCVLVSILWGGIVRLLRSGWEGQLTLDERTLAEAETVLWEAARL